MNHKTVFWVIVTILLFLRIPMASWSEYLWPYSASWIEPIYVILTYLLTVYLIWRERDNLATFHFDFWSVVLILIFPPISVLILPIMGSADHLLALPHFAGYIILSIALIALVLIFFRKIDIGRPDRHASIWFLIGSLAGIGISVLSGVMMILLFNYPVPQDPGKIAWLAPIYQLGYAAVPEESLFRGFLWGGLLSLKLKNHWILLVQAVLFTIAHIHLLDTPQPVLFFSLTFINALLFGLIVWRSHSLAASIGMHGFINGAILAQYWVYSVLFHH